MIVTEQLHKNLYRSYFIGYKPGKKISFPEMRFLTTNPLYAYFYSGAEGFIKEYKLKSGLNIFNARSKRDFYKLHKYIIENHLHYNYDTLERLKSEDWVFVLGDDYKRESLLDILIILGFDGFFNFEYDSKMRKKLKAFYPEVDLPKTENNPAIGVFGDLESLFIEVETYTKEDLLQLEAFQEFKESEILLLKTSFKALCNHSKEEQVIETLKNQDWVTLTVEEVDQYIKEVLNTPLKPLPEWLKRRQGLL